MSVMVAEVAASTRCVPSNGLGAVSATFATDHLSTGAEVYTATTCTATWPGGGTPADATALGDLVTTADGYWGLFVSGNATVVTVDKWRFKNGGTGIPAANADCRIFDGGTILANARQTYVHRITIQATAGGAFIVGNPFGTALYTHTMAAAGTKTLEFCTGQGEPGLMFDTAIAFVSAAGITASVVFSS